jgi:hypothetical protein
VLALLTQSATQYAAQQEVAEALLGLTDRMVARLSAAQLVRVSLAVVLQLNMQVEAGLDPFVVASETSSAQAESVTYRDVAIHPQALEIITQVQSAVAAGNNMVEAFGRIRAVRSSRTMGGGVSPTQGYGQTEPL